MLLLHIVMTHSTCTAFQGMSGETHQMTYSQHDEQSTHIITDDISQKAKKQKKSVRIVPICPCNSRSSFMSQMIFYNIHFSFHTFRCSDVLFNGHSFLTSMLNVPFFSSLTLKLLTRELRAGTSVHIVAATSRIRNE